MSERGVLQRPSRYYVHVVTVANCPRCVHSRLLACCLLLGIACGGDGPSSSFVATPSPNRDGGNAGAGDTDGGVVAPAYDAGCEDVDAADGGADGSVFPGSQDAGTCPFDMPVITVPPHGTQGFCWGRVIRPMGDSCITDVIVDPSDERIWYVAGHERLYVTKDGGHTWTKPLSGFVGAILMAPGKPQRVYAGMGNELYLSRDDGKTWSRIHSYEASIVSILVAASTLFVGLHWDSHAVPSGVFASDLDGSSTTFHPFGPEHTGLIVWTLASDPEGGSIYAGTEIFDHPEPYHPSFFRSTDEGEHWTNVTGSLPWHVIDAAVRPDDGYVYALTEGSGLYRSSDMGDTWKPPVASSKLGLTLRMDPHTPTHLWVFADSSGCFRDLKARETLAG